MHMNIDGRAAIVLWNRILLSMYLHLLAHIHMYVCICGMHTCIYDCVCFPLSRQLNHYHLISHFGCLFYYHELCGEHGKSALLLNEHFTMHTYLPLGSKLVSCMYVCAVWYCETWNLLKNLLNLSTCQAAQNKTHQL